MRSTFITQTLHRCCVRLLPVRSAAGCTPIAGSMHHVPTYVTTTMMREITANQWPGLPWHDPQGTVLHQPLCKHLCVLPPVAVLSPAACTMFPPT